MRALLLATLLLAPLASGQTMQAPVAVLDTPGSILALDTAHLTAKIRFDVTNPGTVADYVTIPRMDIRWVDSGQTALGVPTPEFGLALGPGATGEMWVRVDVQEPRAGQYTVSVPFKSEATGASTTVRVPLTVAQAPPPSNTIRIRVVDERGAPIGAAAVEVTELTATTPFTAPTTPVNAGEWTMKVGPGKYAVRADAAGKAGASAFVDLEQGEDRTILLTLRPQLRKATLVSMDEETVDDSVWLLAASDDLATLATAPMVHKTDTTPGHFHVLREGATAWHAAFREPAPGKHDAGPFQALDTAAAVSAKGDLVAGFDWSGRLHVYDAEGVELWSTDASSLRDPLYPPSSPYGQGFFTSGAAAFSPDGTRLVAGGSSGWTMAFDARTGDVLWTRGFGGEVRAVRFLPDGARVAVGAGDWRMRVLDAGTGETVWEGHNEFWPLFFIALDKDATRLASGGKDATLRVWNASTGEELLAVDVWPGFVSGAGILNDSVVMSDWQFGVRRVGLDATPQWFRRFPTANVATTPDGTLALVAWSREGGSDGGLALLDEGGTTLWSAKPDLARVCTSDVSPFPAKQLKSVHVADLGGGMLRGAAACIGGGVFTFKLRVETLDAPASGAAETPQTTPTQPPTSTRSGTAGDPSPPRDPGEGPSPEARAGDGPGTNPTPLPAWIVLAAIAGAASRGARRAASRARERRGSP